VSPVAFAGDLASDGFIVGVFCTQFKVKLIKGEKTGFFD
jgi:hypothetical protein